MQLIEEYQQFKAKLCLATCGGDDEDTVSGVELNPLFDVEHLAHELISLVGLGNTTGSRSVLNITIQSRTLPA